MIRTLLSSDNTATVEDIARAFVNSDPSQLEYYKQIAKRWPHITLRKHNVIKWMIKECRNTLHCRKHY